MAYKINGKLYTDNPMVDEIVYNLKNIMDGLIIKFQEKADALETVESIQESDIYISLTNGVYSYEMFKYTKDLLSKLPDLTSEEIERYAEFNNSIPSRYHDELLKIALDNYKYEEYNDYYRRLYGLPDYGLPGLYLSNTDIPNSIKDSIDTSIPIHEYTDYQIGLLENEGVIKTLQNRYPDLEYLHHLGTKKIDPYDARTAKKFEIIYIPTNVESIVSERFREVYEKNRIIYMKRHYSLAYKYQNDHYDQFFAIMLISQTVTDIIAEIPEWYVRRDVFDARTVEYILTSHGIPYYQEIPLKYQISLVRQLNKIIKYKSSNRNLKDLASIFDYDANISKYFIMKSRKKDDDGNFIDIDEDNLSNCYDLFFVKAGINDTLIDSINDNSNIEQYDVVTEQDPYWDGPLDHEYVRNKILSKDFSYETTKYMGLDVKEKAADYKFELAYFLNILFNNNIDKSALEIMVPIIDLSSTPCDIMDLFLFMYIISFEYFDNASDDDIHKDISNRPTIDYGPEIDDDYYPPTIDEVIEKDGDDTKPIRIIDLDFDGQTSTQSPLLYNADGGGSSPIYKSFMIDGNTEINLDEDVVDIGLEYVDIVEDEDSDTSNSTTSKSKDDDSLDWYYDSTVSEDDIENELLFDDIYDINLLDPTIIEDDTTDTEPNQWNKAEVDTNVQWNGYTDDLSWISMSKLSQIISTDNTDTEYATDTEPNQWNKAEANPNVQWNGDSDSLSWITMSELSKILSINNTAVYGYMNIDLSDKVLGFNLNADLNYISRIIARPHFSLGFTGGYTLSDLGIDKFTTCSGSIIDAEQLIDIYHNNKECYYNLRDLIINANNEHERVLFTYVFEYLFTTPLNDDYFTLKNGEKATSYKEFLADKNKILYDYLDYLMLEDNPEIRRSNISAAVDQIIESIDTFLNCPDLTNIYSGIAPRSWSVIFGYLKLLIEFFKSYKVTFFEIGINTVYDDEVENNAYSNDILAARYESKVKGSTFAMTEVMSEREYEYNREDTIYPDDDVFFDESYTDIYYTIDGFFSKTYMSYLDLDGDSELSGGRSNSDNLYIDDIEDEDMMDGGSSASDMYVELGIVDLDASNSTDHTEPDIFLEENLEWDGGTSSFDSEFIIYDGGPSREQPHYFDWGNFENYWIMPDEIKVELFSQKVDEFIITTEGLIYDLRTEAELHKVLPYDEFMPNFVYYTWSGTDLVVPNIVDEASYIALRDSEEGLYIDLQSRKILTDIHLYARNIREWIDADEDAESYFNARMDELEIALPSKERLDALKAQLNTSEQYNSSLLVDDSDITKIESSITWKTIE